MWVLRISDPYGPNNRGGYGQPYNGAGTRAWMGRKPRSGGLGAGFQNYDAATTYYNSPENTTVRQVTTTRTRSATFHTAFKTKNGSVLYGNFQDPKTVYYETSTTATVYNIPSNFDPSRRPPTSGRLESDYSIEKIVFTILKAPSAIKLIYSLATSKSKAQFSPRKNNIEDKTTSYTTPIYPQPRAPKGGTYAHGKFYKGGQLMPMPRLQHGTGSGWTPSPYLPNQVNTTGVPGWILWGAGVGLGGTLIKKIHDENEYIDHQGIHAH